MDTNTRYGIASGKRMTLADGHFHSVHRELQLTMDAAINSTLSIHRHADREVKEITRRLVRAALDVERQRCFEKGMEAFAAMPMVRERNVTSGPGFWTGD